jgi:hypothetical protein
MLYKIEKVPKLFFQRVTKLEKKINITSLDLSGGGSNLKS